MSTLWNVEVERLDGPQAVLRVASAHPDAGPWRTDATFALRMLYEPAHEPDGFEWVAAGPLGDAAGEDDVLSDRWAAENAGRFVASVRTEEDELPSDAAVGSTATYVIEVTDPRWLAHLRPGQRWSSAAFS